MSDATRRGRNGQPRAGRPLDVRSLHGGTPPALKSSTFADLGVPDALVRVLVELTAAPGRTVVFTRTKRGAKMLTRRLVAAGASAVELHGNLAQAARTRNLQAFSDGDVRTLVATDIAARGIAVEDVALVVHADPPAEHKAYLHRSGRTARAGGGHGRHADDRRPGARGAGADAQSGHRGDHHPPEPGSRAAAQARPREAHVGTAAGAAVARRAARDAAGPGRCGGKPPATASTRSASARSGAAAFSAPGPAGRSQRWALSATRRGRAPRPR